jgi:hypothetical protein
MPIGQAKVRRISKPFKCSTGGLGISLSATYALKRALQTASKIGSHINAILKCRIVAEELSVGPHVLFNGQHIYDFVEIQKDKLKKTYEALPDDKALDESFTQDLKKQYMLDIPTLKPDEWTSEQRDISSHASEIVAYIPFDGDPAVFNIRPSAFNGTVAQGEIVDHDLLIRVRPMSPEFDVATYVKREIGQVEWRLNSLRGTMEHMNQQLEATIHACIAQRKRVVEKKAKISQNIGIPRRQPSIASTPTIQPKPTPMAQPVINAANSIWAELAQLVTNRVANVNRATGAAYRVDCNAALIQVIPTEKRIDTVTFTRDPESHFLRVVCTISEPGIPRHGKFKMANGRIVSMGDFVGEPQPDSAPMTVEMFAEFVLGPYFQYPPNIEESTRQQQVPDDSKDYWSMSAEQLERQAHRFNIGGYGDQFGHVDRDIIIQRLRERDKTIQPEPLPVAQAAARRPAASTDSQHDWDVFISHASEDKDEIARPLAEALRNSGLRVWYDEFSLNVGDSLRESIDHGLARSKHGVVILSDRFFEKHWPTKELNGLATREVAGVKVILPVWHKVTQTRVSQWSPMLSDRVAVSTDKGLDRVVEALLRAMSVS